MLSSPLRSLLLVILMAGMALALAPKQSRAQKAKKAKKAKSAVYVELAGNSLVYSINYDRKFTSNISGRVGLMRAGISGVSLTIVPLTGNYLLGSGNHRFELGIGPQIFNVTVNVGGGGFGFQESGTIIGGTATIGYRYQPTSGGFVFRIGFTPSFSSAGLFPWAGLSLGYAF